MGGAGRGTGIVRTGRAGADDPETARQVIRIATDFTSGDATVAGAKTRERNKMIISLDRFFKSSCFSGHTGQDP